MRIAVSGSIATDHLMTFPGEFAGQLLAERLDVVSLSFLVDELVVRRGGVAANIAYGLGLLGLRPVLLGGVGADFGDYRAWLERHGVDCSHVHVSRSRHTARFVCTTDRNQCQIASFYPGAMAESGAVRLSDIGEPFDLVLIGADEPATMLARADECRKLGIPFAVDPSQQLARFDGADIMAFIDGARYLLTNEYEGALLEAKTGCTAAQLQARVEVRVTTLADRGVHVATRHERFTVPAAATARVVDPTGVGDGFRAGFFAGVLHGRSLRESARLGCLVAARVIESAGSQEYTLD
ncbi:carbohydrate kinase family protein [Dactylosporangium matsuzakiense]|uniref:carbohydrate kinase family protein n=1 Tax=Dactylosporangium matsuzakiense TaxID=53360 RepID=UPI0021C435C3|nr:carbohydrate kinase family protein [Dactylosporangium matsuzakiense]UWZ49735.1 carbohydrate kinase family protein [Dactylosporangium matsuzakiense]